MSTKPAQPALWDTNGTHLVVPTSGHISDGFGLNEIPASDEENGWKNNVGAWTNYLSDGAMQGNFSFDSSLAFTSMSSPVTLPGSPNENYAVAATVMHLRLFAADVAHGVIGGITNGTAGRIMFITNIGTVDLTFVHNDGGSTGANRFGLAGAANFKLPPGALAAIFYDGVSLCWRLLSSYSPDVWRWSTPFGVLTGTMARSNSTTAGWYENTFNNAGAILGVPICPAVGETITQIGARVIVPGSVGLTATLKLYRMNIANGAAILLATATAGGNISPTVETITATLVTPEIVADQTSYWLDWEIAATQEIFGLGAIGYKVA